jgi:hypothetical protein
MPSGSGSTYSRRRHAASGRNLRSEIGGVRRSIRLLLIAVILALVGVLTTLLVELL